MILTIELLYLIAMTAAVAASGPQIRQLLITKQSDELSLSTWTIWLLTQCVATTYAISISSIPYAIASTCWLLFYLVMVMLIIRYRRTKPLLAHEEVPVETQTPVIK